MRRKLRFILPSLIGVLAFLLPVKHEGVTTIPIGMMQDVLTDRIEKQLPTIVLLIVTISALLSLWFSAPGRQNFSRANPIRRIFTVGTGALALRIAGLVITLMVYFQVGPEAIWSAETGRIVVFDLSTALVVIFLFASFLLPLLTDFGLMEFAGTLLSRAFRRLFLLPGRSGIDALASWMASAAIGVLITSQQFESGKYSAREAAVIATNFSVVSLPFCVIVAEASGMAHRFFEFYSTVVVAGLIAAFITPRIPPLSRIPNTYSTDEDRSDEERPGDASLLQVGMARALQKAESAPGPRQLVRGGLTNLFDIWFGLIPSIIAIGTLGMVIAEETPIFQYLSYPLIPLLQLFGLPEGAEAAPALLIGFIDMFLPTVLAKSIDSELTRLVVISVSITQLIYMTEVGVLILKSPIPLNFGLLIQIFLLRTVITLPIAVGAAHLLV